MPRVRLKEALPRAEDEALARRIGARLRNARKRAGLTQQQLAAGRYTKAYVSALENGTSKPSMSALTFLAARLGVPASHLINDEPPAWARLEADLALACGSWEEAVGAYGELLETVVGDEQRAEVQRGLAEALTRLGRGREAIAAAAEAADRFHASGREADAALAEYWLSNAEYQQQNVAEAKAILQSILARVRGGLRVEPDFEVRLLMALSSNESREGNHTQALAYLEEVRGLAERLDDRRRATYLQDLAYSYRETGDFEAAVRHGIASLELYRRTEAERETAMLENDLALSYLALGNAARAEGLCASARTRLERLADRASLAHALDTQAQIALSRGDVDDALSLALEAERLAAETGNTTARTDALLTAARAQAQLGDMAGRLENLAAAAELARATGAPGLIRTALREWADALAAAGQHERAYALMREAVGV